MSAATLGDVLYPGTPKKLVSEDEWVTLVRSIGAGDQRALHALYDRAHRAVFTLAVRITHDRATAEEVTLDVFQDVWRNAVTYDPANGTVLGWVMNQARSRSIDRLRFEQRKKRVNPYEDDPLPGTICVDPYETLERQQSDGILRKAVLALTAPERQAIEAAYFAGLTHAEVAARLNEPLGTIRTRIRSALAKLRRALAGT